MRKVLVADDDPMFREMICMSLAEIGYEVIAAEDGQAAWEMLEAQGADMAVLDLNMPRLDGLGLIARIRADARYARMPIMLLTVRELIADQISGYDRGADDYLTKPFEHKVFAARLKVLERRILSAGG
jgi:DNA-binding response OmpR family regulator